ncbi:hypothetical protein [Psychrobium sp. 1_MG-2023]|uniref:hypothetical protein n=1 Tax=Psychrobium sp. 1_MG-2023 TaxID=3062624 RepID=UPI000C33734F|nr:hypothetical protein [Psychrobium sp. 1_MG-2023]MDP2560627.1 hypothetical protein [Psychrobium sp. 1_MG-2023]PKF57612.1 hypothetical protein CW748_06925 [Alteromonadales bacterium alter-6D02]
MAVTIEKDTTQFMVSSFPKCVFGLCVLFLLIFWSAVLLVEQAKQLKAVDYFIFSSICLIGMIIQKHKKLSLNKQNNQAILVVKSILGTKEQRFSLTDIESVEMVYGRGQYARGGAIYLVIDGQKQAIVDSDICFGNVERNIRVKEEISQWL